MFSPRVGAYFLAFETLKTKNQQRFLNFDILLLRMVPGGKKRGGNQSKDQFPPQLQPTYRLLTCRRLRRAEPCP